VTIMVREDGRERAVPLGPHDTFVVPRGVEHKPVAPKGASVLMVEPTGTVNVGDKHEELPENVTATTGITLG
jgi:mannose-6-phosphate isomerase-like protein (cupin superfamily)